MGDILLTAFALVFVIEGIMPFANPKTYKKTMQQVIKMPETSLRTMGFLSMIVGVVMLYIVN